MNILVTGGAGFAGGNFVRWLLEGEGRSFQVARIVVLDSLSRSGEFDNLSELEGKYLVDFIQGDIRDDKLVAGILTKHRIDAIVNFSHEQDGKDLSYDPLSYIKTNVEGIQVLLKAAVQFRIARFIQISTSSVYGGEFLMQGRDGSDFGCAESAPLTPDSSYAASRIAGDALVLGAHRESGLSVSIVRGSSLFGPCQSLDSFIPQMIVSSIGGEDVQNLDITPLQSALYIDDHSQAVMKVLLDGRPGEVYNVGSFPEEMICSEDFEKILRESFLDYFNRLEQEGCSSIEKLEVKDLPNFEAASKVDCSKIKSELGWKPTVPLSEGLSKTFKWYANNRQWWHEVFGEKIPAKKLVGCYE